MSGNRSGLECALWPCLLGVTGNPTLTGFSPVLGSEPIVAVGGHGVGAGLVSVELKPSACVHHDCLLMKTF